jgi:TetR/AcrR family tetracycline transcriptional repressor
MPLSRDEVLQGAIRLVNEHGLEALTMRRLAEALGVQAGAIYWHFADKQELYDAMGDSIMAGMLEPPLTGGWEAQLAEICRRIADNFLKMRDGAMLATRGLRPGPNALAVSEKMLAVAREAGFSREHAIWATAALGYYVLGWVTDLQATEAAMARGLRSVLKSFAKNIDRDKYPNLAELGEGGLEHLTSTREFSARFEYGLQVIIDGLRAVRRRAPEKKSPKKPTKPTPPKPRRRR